MKTFDLYFYLAKRDKQGVRILAKFLSKQQSPTRLNDDNLTKLNIPSNYLNEINQKVYESRMSWEPWVETAEKFEDLTNLLAKRGYKNIPISARTEIAIMGSILLNNRLENQVSMLRKS
jgi:hypothetical protein